MGALDRVINKIVGSSLVGDKFRGRVLNKIGAKIDPSVRIRPECFFESRNVKIKKTVSLIGDLSLLTEVDRLV